MECFYTKCSLTCFCFFLLNQSLFCSSIDPARDLYQKIHDIRNPTESELLTLQRNLLSIKRPILNRMPETGHVPRNFTFIKNPNKPHGEKKSILINCDKNQKDKCIISYASLNSRFPLGIKRLAKAIRQSDYQGHFLYQIGGFPNIAEGDLVLAHVPFAFKVAFFKEAQAKGYQRVLWLDTSIIPAPNLSLNWIFDVIRNIGFFIQKNDHPIHRYMNSDAAQAFGMSLKETENITSCSASIIGLDLTNERALELLNAWHKAAHHPFAFFSDRSDQNALSILVHQQKLFSDLFPRKCLGSLGHQTGHFFLMDRTYVKD